jgi:hypothetical protein
VTPPVEDPADGADGVVVGTTATALEEMVAEPAAPEDPEPAASPASDRRFSDTVGPALRFVSGELSVGRIDGRREGLGLAGGGVSANSAGARGGGSTGSGGFEISRTGGSTGGGVSRRRGAVRSGGACSGARRVGTGVGRGGSGAAAGGADSRSSIGRETNSCVIHDWPDIAQTRPTWTRTDTPNTILQRRIASRASNADTPPALEHVRRRRALRTHWMGQGALRERF